MSALPTPSTGPPAGAPEPPVPESLSGRAVGGAVWAMIGFGGGQLVRLASNLVLTRLLFAELFGLMALVQVLIQGLWLFSDIGLGPSVIRSKRGDDPRFLDTAFTLQAVRGVILWMAACAVALPFARFYDEPRLAILVPVAALSSAVAGLQSTKLLTASREIALARVNLIELGSQMMGAIAMIIFALLYRSVWALVAGTLVSSAAKSLLTHLVLPGANNRLRWDGAAAREIVSFGRWIFLSTLVTFLAGQSDRLIFGKLVPLGLLGIYGLAANIAVIPWRALSQLTSSVYYPLYARVLARGEDLGAEMRRTRAPVLLLGAWATAGLIAGGPTAIRLLYDARYVEGGWMLQWLALGLWFVLLENFNGAGVLALGKPQWLAAANVVKFIGMLVLIPFGHHLFGFPGAVAAVAGLDFIRHGLSTLVTERAGLRCWPGDLRLTLVLVGVAGGIRLVLAQLPAGIPIGLEAALVAALASLAFLPAGWPHLRRLIARRRAGQRRPASK